MNLEPQARAWVEARWAWLSETLGERRVREVEAIVPDEAHFPDAYDGTPDAARAMFQRIQSYMGLRDVHVTLSFMEPEERPPGWADHGGLTSSSGAAGLFTRYGEQPVVILAPEQLADPLALAATIAHELGHVLLIGQGYLTGEEPDHEPLTDLLTVYLGLGVFTANTVVRSRTWSDGFSSGWSVSALGYMTQPEFAHALSLFARDRGETSPPWVAHLTPDIRQPLERALRSPPEPLEAPPPLEELSSWRGEEMWAQRRTAAEEEELEPPGTPSLGWLIVVAAILLGLCLAPALSAPDVAILLGLCLAPALSAPDVTLHLVNGTPHPATITLDDAAQVIPAYERRRIELPAGTHRLRLTHPWDTQERTLELSRQDAKRVVVINVAGAAPLLIEAREYVPVAAAAPPSPESRTELVFGETVHRLTNIDAAFEAWPERVRASRERVSNPVVRRLTVELAPPGIILASGYPTEIGRDLGEWLTLLERLDPERRAQLQALRAQLELEPAPRAR